MATPKRPVPAAMKPGSRSGPNHPRKAPPRAAVRPAARRPQSNPVSDALNAIGRGAVGAQNALKSVPNALAQGILQGKKSPLQKVLEGQPTSKRRTTSRRA